ncbi:MAG: alpha-E domain-containing protein [Verrucomicrobia bacterium]|nr:alpha-E domain-containing protein [Verrucomicrobiota bacterium]
MLSRCADALFWLSRYTERAENNARMLDVNVQLALDTRVLNGSGDAQRWESIIFSLEDNKLFQSLYQSVSEESVIEFVTFERKNPNSIYSCLSSARENARTVREQISTEMWEQINRMFLFFKSGEARRLYGSSVYEFFKWILEASHLFQGITDATMGHDEGWDFVQLGKLLERGDRTSRILDIKYHILLPSGERVGGTVDTLEWMSVLRSCSALEPYRKHYRGQVAPWKVAEFLIKNPSFPRSILFCVDAFDSALHKITGVERGDHLYSVEAERLSGKLLADLSYITIQEIFQNGLHEYMDAIQLRLTEISEAIHDEFCDWLDVKPDDNQSQSQSQSGTQSQSQSQSRVSS